MISKDTFMKMFADGGTHRKQFSFSSGVQKNKPRPTFSVPFDQGLLRHFRDATGKSLRWNDQHQQFYCFLDANDIEQIEAWEARQGTRVFIRNLLNSTTALDLNFIDNASGARTHVGNLETQAKHSQNAEAIEELTVLLTELVDDVSYLGDCDAIVGIPPAPNKIFDLPTVLASKLAKATDKHDLSSCAMFTGEKQSLKDLAVAEKWSGWNVSGLCYADTVMEGRRIMLLDDKYQSGATMHFVASRLFAAGATEVHGLAVVKTLRDTDNFDVIDA